MQYLSHWQFWVAVVVVAFVINWLWGMVTKSKGQLV